MTSSTLMLEPDTLWAKVLQSTAHAERSRVIESIPTKSEFIEDHGVDFFVRIVASLERKDQARNADVKRDANPFLPYETDLFVADISDSHVCILNKFNVVEHHLLIVTRSFEDQLCPLTLRDFEAMWACMTEFDGMAFYNGGEIAGASQRHKHLQMVPLPLAPRGPKVPIDPLITNIQFHNGTGIVSGLPFVHAVSRIDSHWIGTALEGAAKTLAQYWAMLHATGLTNSYGVDRIEQLAPYNLIVTREWMLLVPRSEECFEGISLNSLGFAGGFLVRDKHQLKALRAVGPMAALKHVALACEQSAT